MIKTVIDDTWKLGGLKKQVEAWIAANGEDAELTFNVSGSLEVLINPPAPQLLTQEKPVTLREFLDSPEAARNEKTWDGAMPSIEKKPGFAGTIDLEEDFDDVVLGPACSREDPECESCQ